MSTASETSFLISTFLNVLMPASHHKRNFTHAILVYIDICIMNLRNEMLVSIVESLLEHNGAPKKEVPAENS